MTPVVLVLGTAWGAVTGAWCWSATTARRQPQTHPSSCRGAPTSELRLVSSRRLVLRGHRRYAAGLVVALAAAVLLHPVVGLAPIGTLWAWPRLEQRRRTRRELAAIVDQLPDVIDLLRLTTLAGLPVSAALLAIDDRPGGRVGVMVHEAARRLSRGATTSEALTTLARRGREPIRPLVDALIDHDRYGTPLGPALDRVGIEARLHRRRQAEEAARRLPVTLLFPLVFTTLPACGLLTVIPLLVASLSSLQP